MDGCQLSTVNDDGDNIGGDGQGGQHSTEERGGSRPTTKKVPCGSLPMCVWARARRALASGGRVDDLEGGGKRPSSEAHPLFPSPTRSRSLSSSSRLMKVVRENLPPLCPPEQMKGAVGRDWRRSAASPFRGIWLRPTVVVVDDDGDDVERW
jgi:hypothetical protein